ncbi:VIT1/CCC1 transporter family protein [Geoglobus sp.]
MRQDALEFYREEFKDSLLYRTLADGERDEDLRREFIRIHTIEARHADFWRRFLESRGVRPERVRVGRLSLWMVRLLRRISPALTSSLLEFNEMSAIIKYYDFFRAYELSDGEREELREIIVDEIEHEKFFSGKKRLFGAENVRDMVLGINDGLVEILGVVTGLSAVYVSRPDLVGMSGLVVGVAGALSMASGSFISVRSQRQVNETRVRLKAILRELRGESIEVEEIRESELKSAIYTGTAYLCGVALPVIPYFIAETTAEALPLSLLLSAALLAIVGSLISLLSGIPLKKKAAEMLVAGMGTAFLSYLFGTLVASLFHVPLQ